MSTLNDLVGDFLNELSNDGAKQQFLEYLEPLIIPAMVSCARVRLYACHAPVSHGDCVVHVHVDKVLFAVYSLRLSIIYKVDP